MRIRRTTTKLIGAWSKEHAFRSIGSCSCFCSTRKRCGHRPRSARCLVKEKSEKRVTMATWQGPNDFYGTYTGRWDGRRATLEIDDRVGDHPAWLCNIRLFDHDRDAKYSASHVTHSEPRHCFRDLELKGFGGTTGSKHIGLLLLQTWDTAYLCGYDIWNGKEFGFSFERVS